MAWFRVYFLFLSSLGLAPYAFGDIAVFISWPNLGPNVPADLRIQISETADYQKPVLVARLENPEQFLFRTAKEGTFHYRLSSSSNANIVNGSFIVLEPQGNPTIAIIDWSLINGATGYKVRVVPTVNHVTEYKTTLNAMKIYRQRSPLLVEVVPENSPDGLRFLQTYNQGLTIRQDPPPAAAAVETPEASLPYVPQWYGAVYAAMSKDIPTGDRAGVGVGANGYMPGAAADFEGPIFKPLYFSLSGLRTRTSHSMNMHAVTFDDKQLKFDHDRDSWESLIGFDLLNGLTQPSPHHVILSAGAAYRELLRIPLTQPSLNSNGETSPLVTASLFGSGLNYLYETSSYRVEVGASYFVGNHAANTVKAHINLALQIYGPLQVTTGAVTRLTELERCEDGSSDCSQKAKYSQEDLTGLFGIGLRM